MGFSSTSFFRLKATISILVNISFSLKGFTINPAGLVRLTRLIVNGSVLDVKKINGI